MRRTGCLILLLGLAVVALGGWFAQGWYGTGPSGRDVSFVVTDGSTLKIAARDLEKAELVGSADMFLLRAKLLGGSAPIKAGEYRIPKGASSADILSTLQGGKVVARLITIPEGMPSILVHERLMAQTDLTGTVPVPEEGSVLPDSYAFEKGEARAVVLKRMQDAMTRTLAALWVEKSPDTVVKSPQEAIILASIVEKETGVAAERPTVAGVYSNRLRKGMMLQADPTIIYPITKGKPLGRRIRRSEIMAVNDYNTYAMTGLPKGPIANPGRLSILAVLQPAKTNALYFVADGKGGHVFADTLEQHNANVKRWFEIRRQRGEL
ncbi:MAG: endolytic transglycosylase MltG [Sphingobium sp.]|nr:MAG: endolytic transglycosylase MltG [Sphingobium sp.]